MLPFLQILLPWHFPDTEEKIICASVSETPKMKHICIVEWKILCSIQKNIIHLVEELDIEMKFTRMIWQTLMSQCHHSPKRRISELPLLLINAPEWTEVSHENKTRKTKIHSTTYISLSIILRLTKGPLNFLLWHLNWNSHSKS